MKDNIIRDKSFQFAVRIVKMYEYLYKTKQEYVISKQVLRSGTSIGANIREALNGESTADFVHKLSIAQKEADETLYWLELLRAGDMLEETSFLSIYAEGSELLKMIKSIILTTKQQQVKSKNNS